MSRNQKSRRAPVWGAAGRTFTSSRISLAEALYEAGLAWRVRLEPIYMRGRIGGNLSTVAVPGRYVNVRTDLPADNPNRALGIVSGDYSPCANEDAFAVVDDLVDTGDVRIVHVGALRDGREPWIVAAFPRAIRVGESLLRCYLFASTSHDGGGSIKVSFVPVRPSCFGTLHVPLENVKQRISLSHTGDVMRRLSNAKTILRASTAYFRQAAAVFQELAAVECPPTWSEALWSVLWPNDLPDDKPSARIVRIRERVDELYRTQNGRGLERTPWGMFRAVAEYVDQERTPAASGDAEAQQARAETRLNSCLWGGGWQIKRRAFIGARHLEGLAVRKATPNARAALEPLAVQASIEAKIK